MLDHYKINAQLTERLTPVPALSGPLFCCIHHGQIQYLEQGIVRRKDRFGFCDLPELAIEILNGIGRIYQLTDLLGILEVR